MGKALDRVKSKLADRERAERERETAKLRREIASLRGQVAAERERADAASMELELQRATLTTKPGKTFKAGSGKNGKADATAFLVFSDWHSDEVVHPLQVLGRNEFDFSVCERRAKAVTQRGLTLIHDARNLATVRTLVVALLGDFIGGWIHPELEQTNSSTPTVAIIKTGELLRTVLETLHAQAECEEIVVVAMTGNHGRTTKKQQAANRTQTSYEYLMFHNLAVQLGDKVRWHCLDDTLGYLTTYQCGNAVIRLCHGDGVKFQGGIGGIHVPVNKRISRDNTWVKADYDFFGHFHHWQQGDNFCCNGSIKGVDAYAATKGFPYQEPLQTFALCDHKRGMVRVMKLFCD